MWYNNFHTSLILFIKLRFKYTLVNRQQKHVVVRITHCSIPPIHRTFSFHRLASKELIYLLTFIYTLKINAIFTQFLYKIKETNKNKTNIYH